ncbi:hypothetical protein AGLY_006981 [Aphis glycines]|uniref:Uncharacterized protein n=1 Tax=Aphis glycines TaxID=307491 RepID=A0A6G0TR04_APHGL|nr:hypothetical protein AGLY_006981 [Aphis glycines]
MYRPRKQVEVVGEVCIAGYCSAVQLKLKFTSSQRISYYNYCNECVKFEFDDKISILKYNIESRIKLIANRLKYTHYPYTSLTFEVLKLSLKNFEMYIVHERWSHLSELTSLRNTDRHCRLSSAKTKQRLSLSDVSSWSHTFESAGTVKEILAFNMCLGTLYNEKKNKYVQFLKENSTGDGDGSVDNSSWLSHRA